MYWYISVRLSVSVHFVPVSLFINTLLGVCIFILTLYTQFVTTQVKIGKITWVGLEPTTSCFLVIFSVLPPKWQLENSLGWDAKTHHFLRIFHRNGNHRVPTSDGQIRPLAGIAGLGLRGAGLASRPLPDGRGVGDEVALHGPIAVLVPFAVAVDGPGVGQLVPERVLRFGVLPLAQVVQSLLLHGPSEVSQPNLPLSLIHIHEREPNSQWSIHSRVPAAIFGLFTKRAISLYCGNQHTGIDQEDVTHLPDVDVLWKPRDDGHGVHLPQIRITRLRLGFVSLLPSLLVSVLLPVGLKVRVLAVQVRRAALGRPVPAVWPRGTSLPDLVGPWKQQTEWMIGW